MSALVLDAGAFVAAERGDRSMAARLRVAQRADLQLRTTAVVIGQVWRDAGGRQANLARLLKATDIKAVDLRLGQEAGLFLGRAGLDDVVDATVVAVSAPGDRILTSDPEDIGRLVAASGRPVFVVPC